MRWIRAWHGACKKIMTIPQAPVLDIQQLTIGLKIASGHKPLVQDLSLHVHAAETLCVVGESGSGKSLTSLAIMGLLPADSLQVTGGQIIHAGRNLLACTPREMRALRTSQLAMVFQEPMTALNPLHRVGRQIEEVLRLHTDMNATQRRTRVLEMLQAVHLPNIERIYQSWPHQLSGGQRQRIVIAMALILQPRLLIADEPTTALDVTTQKQILHLIRELQQQHGTAVLFITHDFGVVAEIADRIVVMHQGEVVETGTRQQILTQPEQAYTRMLVSSVPSLVPHKRAEITTDPVLRVHGLHMHYPQAGGWWRKAAAVRAAEDVSLLLRRGEIVGIVGESGSGKSTVARCIVRLIDPGSGEIVLQDETGSTQDITRLSHAAMRPLRRRIQIVFQDPYRSLNPRQRIGDSVMEGLRNIGLSRHEALDKATQALELVGLPRENLQRFPHQFSGGQRQRICIARALVMEPDILIADEAVSALDVSVQAQVLALLEEVRQRVGVGVLFITHDLRVAAQICDRILVMQNGRVVESGTANQVLAAPQNDYTRALIDAAPGRNWDFQHFCAVQ